MATWQFDIALVPIAALAADPDLLAKSVTADGIESGPWWSEYREESDLEDKLNQILPKGKSWHDDLSVWGDEEGNRIDLFRDKGVLESLSVRIDARVDKADFLDAVCALAKHCECKFYGYESGSLIEPEPLALRAALEGSNASKFVSNPRAYLKKLAESADS